MDTARPVCQPFSPPPSPSSPSLCEASHLLSMFLCQNASDSRFNVYRLTGRKVIPFKGVKNPSAFNPPSIILISSGFWRKLI